jgi:hypothetical protein
MKISEILTEGDIPANFEKLDSQQVAAIKGALSVPGISQNKSNGNPYAGYRFGLAMAGAPDFPTAATGAIAGDPLLSAYTEEELEIVNAAAKMVGAGKVKRLSSNRSEELSNVNKVSPVSKKKKNKYGV